MHGQARDFTLFVKRELPTFFANRRVLDVGSGDINGNNRFLFDNCEYHGNDVIQAQNVTIVSRTKDLPFSEGMFDTIISTECFEHDPEYVASFGKIYKMLKPGGLFCFTCASTGRAEHGTRRTSPGDSYGTIGNLSDMSDYYRNITELDLNEALDLRRLFLPWDTYYNAETKDLYFLGIKVGARASVAPLRTAEYKGHMVTRTSDSIPNLSSTYHILAALTCVVIAALVACAIMAKRRK
jgi:SAM-dependent methyltransferase